MRWPQLSRQYRRGVLEERLGGLSFLLGQGDPCQAVIAVSKFEMTLAEGAFSDGERLLKVIRARAEAAARQVDFAESFQAKGGEWMVFANVLDHR